MLMLAAYSLSALNGIVAAVKPRVAANIYGYKKVQLNCDQLNTLRGFGYENLAMSVFLLCLLNRVESHKSLGFASLVVVAHCAHHSLLGTTSSSLGVLGSLLKFILDGIPRLLCCHFYLHRSRVLNGFVAETVTALKITSVLSVN